MESIPENLTYSPTEPSHPSTYIGIHDMIALAKETIEIASYYWTMTSADLPVRDPSDWQVGDNLGIASVLFLYNLNFTLEIGFL